MSVTDAKRTLQHHGKKGNWRFKGLMSAALSGDMDSYAKAWPKSGQPSSYRFLARNPQYEAETEANRRLAVDEDDAEYRVLSEYASEDGMDKTLGAAKPKELGNGVLGSGVDDAISRALFAASTPEEVDVLFRNQLLDVVMAGAERRQIAREASDVINVDTLRGDVPVAEDSAYAPQVAQGGEIRDDREDYTTVEWNCEKFASGARVTDEMVRHSQVDLIERQISFLGEKVENAINRKFLTTLVDDAQNNFDTAGSDQGVPALNGAYGEVDSDDFIPDTYVTHPEYRTTLFDDDNIAFANRAGTDDVVRDRVFDPILSVDHYGASDSTYAPDGSNTWGFNTDGELGAVVYDRSRIHTVIENDIEVKDYEDPIRDLQGVNARATFDVLYSQSRASATVEY